MNLHRCRFYGQPFVHCKLTKRGILIFHCPSLITNCNTMEWLNMQNFHASAIFAWKFSMWALKRLWTILFWSPNDVVQINCLKHSATLNLTTTWTNFYSQNANGDLEEEQTTFSTATTLVKNMFRFFFLHVTLTTSWVMVLTTSLFCQCDSFSTTWRLSLLSGDVCDRSDHFSRFLIVPCWCFWWIMLWWCGKDVLFASQVVQFSGCRLLSCYNACISWFCCFLDEAARVLMIELSNWTCAWFLENTPWRKKGRIVCSFSALLINTIICLTPEQF